ncbi:MAG: ROK family protein, partial [Myxococcales bacterium]|nr:ROK family protein [Myxococcales bacterium]
MSKRYSGAQVGGTRVAGTGKTAEEGAPLLLGLDLGGTKVAWAVGDAAGGVRASGRRPTEPTGDPRADVARLAEDLRGAAAAAGIEVSQAQLVGLSVPGPFDPEAGTVLEPPNLPGWSEVPVRSWLEAELGIPVFLENDANAAALAEWHFGAAQGARHAVYLTMSTGVGGGLILDRRLYRGVRGGAGEVGHIQLEWEGELCGCGLRGCAEAYLGGGRWAERLARITPADSRVAELAGGAAHATPKEVVQAAQGGDPFALGEMERFNHYLGRLLAALAFSLAPEVIVLGTIVVAAGEALCLEPVREQVRAHTWPAVSGDLRIVPAV